MSVSPTLRAARLDDVDTMVAITVDRMADITPADPNYLAEQESWWRTCGLDVQGIGRALEADRRAWARGIGRAVRVRVAEGNDRSMGFLHRQGFVLIETQEPTPQQPLRINILELGLTALMGAGEQRSEL